ncbi:MAG: hypothetical protein CSB24_06350 [Deltaproteobacteria bacterium]|nr:MAG: hypothetical protein CSB24_06350 [Deltaproteobacteria bacterium]
MNIKTKQSLIALIRCDNNWRIRGWSLEASRKFGYKKQEVIGKPLQNYVMTALSSLEFPPSLDELILTGRQHGVDNIKLFGVASHADSSNFPVEILVTEHPEQTAYIINIKDLTPVQQPETNERRQIRHLGLINQIYEIALEPYMLKEVLDKILEYLLSIQGLDLFPDAAVFMNEKDPDILSMVAGKGFSEQTAKDIRISTSKDLPAKTTQTCKIQHHEARASTREMPLITYAAPIRMDTRGCGVLVLTIKKKNKYFKDFPVLIKCVAEALSAIIEARKTEQQLLNMVYDLRTSILTIKEEKRYSEAIIQGLNHGLLITDPDGTIRKCNNIAQSILQVFNDGQDVTGQKLTDLLGREKGGAMLSPHQDENQIPVEYELSLFTQADKKLIFRYSTVYVENLKKNSPGLIISFTEISALRLAHHKMERINRLARAAEIASVIAHEVRNPLAGIKLMAQSIEEDSSPGEVQSECAIRIVRQVNRLNELLNDFFSYSRPAPTIKQRISLIEAMREIKPLVNETLIKQNIKLEEHYAEDLPLVKADPSQLQQIFLNIMLNAIDAVGRQGNITVTARKTGEQDLIAAKRQVPGLLRKQDYVQMMFADDGIGMNKSTLDKIFEPFFTTKKRGNGLGMSIVYRIIKENDAAITVDSEPGQGSVFTMFFPAA